ncbi:hypothetical protein [Bosea sp. (in: a-proteobacteria)]|uniref:hypothetical protein n=1 Tax=Bosea sp. (in: a-proteobacteria) TaxID=1871050 RepID=UPI0026171655|nr:hypothetical protein [Bosea sp. (in: a-proteobacteria)]MCO5091965.1 hypothetical protein [Bosea sp. (in: a-proteobacteria)]
MAKQQSVKIDLPSEFRFLCEDADVSPKDVLEGFIRDLCALPGSNGSDERDRAQAYFDRCGYAFMAQLRREQSGQIHTRNQRLGTV